MVPAGGGGDGSMDDMNGGQSGDGDSVDGMDPGTDNGGTDDGAGGDGSDDASGDLPVAFRLDGVWLDNGRNVIVEQNGTTVSAMYFSEYLCDLNGGPVPVNEDPLPGADVESTFFNFEGTLSAGEEVLPGDIIMGQVNFCIYGNDDRVNGFALADMMLTVVDQETLTGEWFTEEFFGTLTLTRQQ